MDLKQIERFHLSDLSDRFASFINSTFREFEELEDKYLTEQDIKNSVKTGYFKFRK